MSVSSSIIPLLLSAPVMQMMLMIADLRTYLHENIADVLIIVGAFLVLICSLLGYFIYLSYMSKDEANKDRLLNVLYAARNMSQHDDN